MPCMAHNNQEAFHFTTYINQPVLTTGTVGTKIGGGEREGVDIYIQSMESQPNSSGKRKRRRPKRNFEIGGRGDSVKLPELS
jgi:hypothetical protein